MEWPLDLALASHRAPLVKEQQNITHDLNLDFHYPALIVLEADRHHRACCRGASCR